MTHVGVAETFAACELIRTNDRRAEVYHVIKKGKFNNHTAFHLTNRWKSHSLLASGTFNFFLKAASRAEMRTHPTAAKHHDTLLRMRHYSSFSQKSFGSFFIKLIHPCNRYRYFAINTRFKYVRLNRFYV